MVDYRDQGYVASFSGAGSSLNHEDIFITRFYEYLAAHGQSLETLSYEQLCGYGLILADEEGNIHKRYNLVNCLIFDTELDNQTQIFHLTEGKWYRVENSYIAKLTEALDPLWTEIPLAHFTHDSEGHYNEAIAADDGAFICLDMENIGPPGQTQIEPCDLYSVDGEFAVFHHIKRSTVSAQLSHLFIKGTTP